MPNSYCIARFQEKVSTAELIINLFSNKLFLKLSNFNVEKPLLIGLIKVLSLKLNQGFEKKYI